jgi:serine O-acetyltransferase
MGNSYAGIKSTVRRVLTHYLKLTENIMHTQTFKSNRHYINALSFYYIGRLFKKYKIPLLPRVCEFIIFVVFGSSIPISAEIGSGGYCEHRGQGLIIHSSAKIGTNVRIFPQVTVGGSGGGVSGVPRIGDSVVIGTGAKILGPITVGDGCHIGANAVVLIDIPSGCNAIGVPAKAVIREGDKQWQ